MLAITLFSESDKDKNYFGEVDVSRPGVKQAGMVHRSGIMF
jgi:hypothetical protein